jgi:hypothetical protein
MLDASQLLPGRSMPGIGLNLVGSAMVRATDGQEKCLNPKQ